MQVYTIGTVIACCLLAWFPGCHMDFREALWQKTGTTDSIENNENAAACGEQYLGMEYVGVRLRTSRGKTTCESLPLDWLTNQTTSPGYLYLYKIWSKVTMIPPLELSYRNNGIETYTTALPGLFNRGSSVTFTYLHKDGTIYDYRRRQPNTAKVALLYESGTIACFILIESGRRACIQAILYGNNYKTLKYHNKYYNNGEIPDCSRVTCKLTLFAGRDYIELNGTNFKLNFNVPTTVVKQAHVFTDQDALRIELFSLEFNNS